MTHMSNFNLTNFKNFPITNNELNIQDNEWEIQWVIDRTPDHNLINNINFNHEYDDVNFVDNIRNQQDQYFHDQFARATQTLLNGTIQFNIHNEDTDIDNFIPFQPQSTHLAIQTEVRSISVSQEERDCVICYETRELQDITLINCGHKFCVHCITHHIRINRRQPCCPLCRKNIELITFQLNNHEQDLI